MLLVTGASGKLSEATVSTLRTLVRPSQIAVTTTNPGSPAALQLAADGINVREADFRDRNSMMRALEGIERMYLIPNNDDDTVRFAQHQNVIEAAKTNGVGHIAFASFLNADDLDVAHNAYVYAPTEQAIRESGIPYTMLRNSIYAETLLVGLDKIEGRGVVYTSAGSSAVTYMPRSEVGVAAAHLLARGGHEGQTYTLTMEKPYSGQEVAAVMSELLGKPIRFEPLSPENYVTYITEWWGIPNAVEFLINVVSSLEAGAAGRYNFATRDFEKLVGRAPQDLKRFLEASLPSGQTTQS